LMKRIAAAGLEIWHVPQSRIVHLAGQATGHRFGDRPQRISPHWLLSRARYFGRHHGRMGLITGSILFLAGDLLYRLSCLVRLKKPNRSPLMWRDYMRFGFSTSAERLPNGRG
jgi:GT2 family glycosyltransferase